MADNVSLKDVLRAIDSKTKGAYKRIKNNVQGKVRGLQIPGGLVNEIAEISSVSCGSTKKGDPYLFINCIAITPRQYKGARVVFQYFFMETKYTSPQDVLENLLSDLANLGYEFSEVPSLSQIETLLKGLVEEKTRITYNTTAGKDSDGNPQARCFLAGLDQAPPDSADEVLEEVVEEEGESEEEIEEEEVSEEDSEEVSDDTYGYDSSEEEDSEEFEEIEEETPPPVKKVVSKPAPKTVQKPVKKVGKKK